VGKRRKPCWPMAQVEGAPAYLSSRPEFKPQYHERRKNKGKKERKKRQKSQASVETWNVLGSHLFFLDHSKKKVFDNYRRL
jgi:hypothetical protein